MGFQYGSKVEVGRNLFEEAGLAISGTWGAPPQLPRDHFSQAFPFSAQWEDGRAAHPSPLQAEVVQARQRRQREEEEELRFAFTFLLSLY